MWKESTQTKPQKCASFKVRDAFSLLAIVKTQEPRNNEQQSHLILWPFNNDFVFSFCRLMRTMLRMLLIATCSTCCLWCQPICRSMTHIERRQTTQYFLDHHHTHTQDQIVQMTRTPSQQTTFIPHNLSKCSTVCSAMMSYTGLCQFTPRWRHTTAQSVIIIFISTTRTNTQVCRCA